MLLYDTVHGGGLAVSRIVRDAYIHRDAPRAGVVMALYGSKGG